MSDETKDDKTCPKCGRPEYMSADATSPIRCFSSILGVQSKWCRILELERAFVRINAITDELKIAKERK